MKRQRVIVNRAPSCSATLLLDLLPLFPGIARWLFLRVNVLTGFMAEVRQSVSAISRAARSPMQQSVRMFKQVKQRSLCLQCLDLDAKFKNGR